MGFRKVLHRFREVPSVRCAFCWTPPVLYAALIFWASSRSEFRIADRRLMVFDKAAHFFEFAILALLIMRALLHSSLKRTSAWKNVVVVFLLVSLYALTDEWHQSFVPNRHPDVMDWAVDTLGAAVFLLPFLFSSVSDRLSKEG